MVTTTNLNMVPLRRMALFQSFSVDLPARYTNSFGLMRCSFNWNEALMHITRLFYAEIKLSRQDTAGQENLNAAITAK